MGPRTRHRARSAATCCCRHGQSGQLMAMVSLVMLVSSMPILCRAAAWGDPAADAIVYPRGQDHQLDLRLSVRENVPIGTLIGVIQANSSSNSHDSNEPVAQPPYLIVPITGDPSGSGSTAGSASSTGTVRERATRGVDSDLSIDQTTGEIRTAVVLDRERTAFYSFVAIPLAGRNIRVTVQVIDENDNAPKFPVSVVTMEIPENSNQEVKRTLPPARDADIGLFGTKEYRIISGNQGGAFRLNSHREKDDVLYLDLQVNSILDRETQSSYTLVIEALDGGQPPMRGELIVNISILDVNDNEPLFSHSRYYATISETVSVGTSVLRVSATDADQGQSGTISYSLFAKDGGQPLFGINKKNGWIFVTQPLDFEQQEMHELVVVARDNGVQPLETSSFVSVKVTNENDNKPEISIHFVGSGGPGPDKLPSIAESAKIGDLVARVTVKDPDDLKGDGAGLAMTLQGSEGHFSIVQKEPTVYLIVVTAPLDHEKKSRYTLTVSATDQGQPPLNASQTFILLVSDINDNPVYFEHNNYYATLPKNAEAGTHVFQVRALDRDSSATITYRLLNEHKSFAIDPHTGLITTRVRIGRERGAGMQLIVSASDGSAMTATATVVVAISDIDHRELVIGFTNERFVQMSEDCCLPGDVVMLFRLNQSDFAVRYTMASAEGDLSIVEDLALDSQSGLLTLVRPFDYERRQDYKLNVTASIYPKSQHGQSTDHDVFRPPVKIVSQIVHIDLLNVNDESPQPVQREYRKLIPENAEPDTFVMRIECTDPDGDQKLRYMIPENHPSHQLFELNAFTGELRTKAPLDRETQAVHRIPIYVFDAGQVHMRELEALVILEDINEHEPTFSAANRNQLVRVPENILPGAIVHTVVANDQDLLPITDSDVLGQGPGLTYTILSGNHEGMFAINSQRGEISVSKPLDREQQPSYALVVEAYDGLFSATANLTIELIDVNDNAPVFKQPVWLAHLAAAPLDISELGKSQRVLSVAASDPDGDSIHYSINVTSSADAALFEIDSRTGAISAVPSVLLRALRGRQSSTGPLGGSVSAPSQSHVSFGFQVLAQDVSSDTPYTAHLAQSPVQVNFSRSAADNGRPRFRQYPYVIEVDGHRSDYRQAGALIGRVEFDNAPAEPVLRFGDEQSGQKCSDHFTIEARSGEIRVKRSPAQGWYECYIELSGSSVGSTSTLLQIFFTKGISGEIKARRRANNAFTFQTEVAENSPPTTRLINLVSRSRMPSLQSGQHHFQLVYSSIDGSLFNLESGSGMLTMQKSLDYESLTEPTVHLVAVARKADVFDNPVYFNIEITVINVNDVAPRFTQSHYLTYSVEGLSRNADTIAHVLALDYDADDLGQSPLTVALAAGEVRPSGRISYSIIEGNLDNAFSIEPEGQAAAIRINKVLDREIRPKYRLKIAATDEGTGNGQQRLSSTCLLEVTVLDSNDNVPVFPPYYQQEISVNEEAEVGSVISTLTANDVDIFPALTYYKQRTSDMTFEDLTDDLFDIGLYTGRITLKAPLKQLQRRQFALNILASDSQHTVDTKVIVKVKSDPYTTPPALDKPYQYIVVDPLENDCISSGRINCEIGRVQPQQRSDSGPFKVIYRVASDPARNFYIDQLTGIIYNNQSLKLASNKIFSLDIAAGFGREGGRFINAVRSKAYLLINVLRTETRDDFDELALNMYNVEVPAGKLGDVLVTLPLTHKYAYKILDSSVGAEDFLLLRNNQLVKVKRSPMAEYKLEIEGRRKRVRGESVRVLVNVQVMAEGTDVYVPRIYNVKLPDSASIGREVVSVRSDASSSTFGHQKLRYHIGAGNELNHYRIDSQTGSISVAHQLDFEKCNYYQLIVAARKPDDTEITFAIVNVQLTHGLTPKFPFSQQPTLKAMIDEGQPPGTRVVRLIHEQPSPSYRSQLSEMSGAQVPFALDESSGYLVTTDVIDYEQIDPPVYQLVLKSWYDQDQETSGPRRPSSEVLIEVEIGSVDEFAPKFSQDSYSFNLTIGLGMNFIKVGRVMASDRDSGPDGKVIYQLRSSSPSTALNKFRINRSTGLLSLSTLSPDDLPPKSSSLIVSASSGREASLSTLTVVQINLNVADASSENRIYDGPIRPDDLTSSLTPTAATSAGMPGWALFLIILLMIVTVVLLFIIIVIRVYSGPGHDSIGGSQGSFGMGTLLRKRQHDSALSVGPDGSSHQPQYTLHQLDHNDHGLHHPGGPHHPHMSLHPHYMIPTAAANAAPPCYNEVTTSLSSPSAGIGEGHSASSGRGSAEDEDDVDEEIRMIIEGNSYYGDGLDGNGCESENGHASAVMTVNEYLTQLGVINHSEEDILDNLNEMMLNHENDDVVSEDLHHSSTMSKIVRPNQFSSVRSARDRSMTVNKNRRHRSHSYRDLDEYNGNYGMAGPASIATALPTAEELLEIYNWDYLQQWGPKYQPLSAVFTEIAKLKGTEIVDPALDHGPNLYDAVALSRLETASTISAATSHRSLGHRSIRSQSTIQSSPLLSSNPLIQASSTSAFSPVRPSYVVEN